FSSRGSITRDVHLTVLYHDQNTWVIIVGVLVLIIAGFVIVASIYTYYRQRKIRIYKLQKAQEEALKLKVQAPPP
ncbi:hypothetical protein P7M07_23400, partial [Vibrio parahaemolyticus]|nr:hypothetical protein [Vibrio parahaemolyticus]